MPSLALRVEVDRVAADALSDALLEAGAHSVSIDELDSPVATLSALFAEAVDPVSALRAAAANCGIEAREPVVSRLEDEDWVRKTQSQFQPLRLGERLWIGASWHDAPTALAAVRIDPGLAFGTGSHASTRLCLRFLERAVRGGERVLDYGCGSGILAIAAAKLGASDIAAVDVDLQAIEVTRHNATLNGIELRAALADAFDARQYDLVVANILAQPLIELAPLLMASTAARGSLALAGILDSQAESVRRAYGQFDLKVADQEESWVLLSGARL